VRISQGRGAPHTCHVTASLVLNRGHSRGIELARDLGIRTLQKVVKCLPSTRLAPAGARQHPVERSGAGSWDLVFTLRVRE
jgi:hypothetical protein